MIEKTFDKTTTRIFIILHLLMLWCLIIFNIVFFPILKNYITFDTFFILPLYIALWFDFVFLICFNLTCLYEHLFKIIKFIEFDMEDYIKLMQFLKDFSYDVDFISHIKLDDYIIISKYLPGLKKFDQHFIEDFIYKYGDKNNVK